MRQHCLVGHPAVFTLPLVLTSSGEKESVPLLDDPPLSWHGVVSASPTFATRASHHERVAKTQLTDLTLVDLLVHRTRNEHAIDVASLPLAIAMDSGHRLPIRRWVPVAVKEN